MAGAMAGSAILIAGEKKQELDIVTLTINNSCNLRCPHCYLQYAKDTADHIDWANVEHIFASTFRHLCIVGKEPLVNRASASFTSRLVAAAAQRGLTTSIITNGLNLHLLDSPTLSQLRWVDVSLDGGPDSYSSYRGGSYTKLVRSISYAKDHGLRDLRILQTISSGNLNETAATIRAALSFEPKHVVISPFQVTQSRGQQSVEMVSPAQLLRALQQDGLYMDKKVCLALDRGYAAQFGDLESIRKLNECFGNRFVFVESDPIDRGIIRVTYDGLVLSPFESVHTANYSRDGRPLRQRVLNEWYDAILASAQPSVCSYNPKPACV